VLFLQSANTQVVEEQSLSSFDVEKHIEAFKLLCGDSNAELLRSILNNVIEGKKDECDPIVLAPDYDKMHRTASVCLCNSHS
jgi:hypothetical protein